MFLVWVVLRTPLTRWGAGTAAEGATGMGEILCAHIFEASQRGSPEEVLAAGGDIRRLDRSSSCTGW